MCAQQKTKNKQNRTNEQFALHHQIDCIDRICCIYQIFVRHVWHSACIWNVVKSKLRLGFFSCLSSHLFTMSLRFHPIIREEKMGSKGTRDVIIHRMARMKLRKQNEENRARQGNNVNNDPLPLLLLLLSLFIACVQQRKSVSPRNTILKDQHTYKKLLHNIQKSWLLFYSFLVPCVFGDKHKMDTLISLPFYPGCYSIFCSKQIDHKHAQPSDRTKKVCVCKKVYFMITRDTRAEPSTFFL